MPRPKIDHIDVKRKTIIIKVPERPLSRQLQALSTAANPTISVFVGIPKGPDGRLDRGRLEIAVKHGFMIVRWHLEKEV